MPYPAPDLLGLPLCHPLACTYGSSQTTGGWFRTAGQCVSTNVHVESFGPVLIDSQVGRTVQQGIQGHSCLPGGKVKPKTQVRPPVRTRGWRVAFSQLVEGLRLVEIAGELAGRRQHWGHARSCRDFDVPKHGVSRCHPGREQYRGLVTETLFDGLGYERSVGADGLELLGMSEQEKEQVAARTEFVSIPAGRSMRRNE